MSAHESGRKRFMEERLEPRERRNDDDDDRGLDKRKNRSAKSRRLSPPEEAEEHDSGGRRRSGGDKRDDRKRSGSSSRAGSEEDDYEGRRDRDSRSKIARIDQDGRGEKKSSKGHREESGRKNRDDDSDWASSSRKASGRSSEHENIHNKTRNKGEGSSEGERERIVDKDSRHSEKTASTREKDYAQHDEERIPNHRVIEEAEAGRRGEEGGSSERLDARSGKSSDYHKHGPSKDRPFDSRTEPGESKGRTVDFGSDKGVKTSNREDNKEDNERNNSRHARQASHDEDSRHVSVPRETRSDAIRDDKQRKMHVESSGFVEDAEHNIHRYPDDKHRHQLNTAHAVRDDVEIREPSINVDEEGYARLRGRNRGEVRHEGRSRSLERNERDFRDPDDRNRGHTESDNDRSTGIRGKELDDGYVDDKYFRGRDGNWTDKNRERDDSKDYWGRNQTRQDTKEWDNRYDRNKEWDPPRREQERTESEKLHNHSGYKRDARGRLDGRLSSLHRNESDSIEIKPNANFDYAREEAGTGRRNETGSQQNFPAGDEEWGYHPPEDRRKVEPSYDDDQHDRYSEDVSCTEQNAGRYSLDSQTGRGRGPKGAFIPNRPWGVQNSGNGLQPLLGNNQVMGAFNRTPHQGPRSGRIARGGKGRLNGRDAQRVGMPLPPIMGPPYGHIGLPGPMQPLGPNIPHAPGPPIGHGVFIPPFPGPLVWSGPRGVDVNMLTAMPHNLPPIPPVPAGPRFAPNMGSGSNPAMFFNQASPGRGVPPNAVPGFTSGSPAGRMAQHEKVSGGWTPRNTGISGKGPSRGEQNDYSQNFVDTGSRPQNFIRELEITNVVEDYPKLRELIQRKDEIVANSSSPPMYFKCDLREHVLSPEFFGTKFDVILVDPPWEEYVHRAPGVTDNIDYWTFEEIQNLKIEAIADTPSFIFLWVGDDVGLEQGRQCLKKWGFRRCEDICWVKTNKKAPTSLRHDSHTLFQHSKEHCLMGIKGTVRRSTDGHIIHANIDTDIIIAEESGDASSTKKPDDMYRIVEHFALGRRRLELFGEDHNIRSGWLTVGKGLSSSNFNAEGYVKTFADKDGKVWQGGGGRNPPPDAPHLVRTTPEIESLRPKSPPPKNQQQQLTPPLPSGDPNNRRNSPQNLSAAQPSGVNHDASGSELPATPASWASSMGGMRWQENGPGGFDEKFSDGYSFSAPYLQVVGDRIEFDPHRALHMS